MKAKRLHILGVFFLLLLLPQLGSAARSNAPLTVRIRKAVVAYFAQTFGTSEKELKISFVRWPKELQVTKPVTCIEVSDQHSRKRLGYQTVWVELINHGRRIRNLPVSVQVALHKPVWVAAQRIAFRRRIDAHMFRKELRWITDGWDKLVAAPAELVGYEAKRAIEPGTVLTYDLVRKAPLVTRGQTVKVEIRTGSLVITSTGVARQNGTKGESITVTVQPGGKKLKARVVGAGVVSIDQENTL